MARKFSNIFYSISFDLKRSFEKSFKIAEAIGSKITSSSPNKSKISPEAKRLIIIE
jgi:hypothetical protein